jgi:hypothetical protein
VNAFPSHARRPHDEARAETQDGGEIELGAAANHELRGVVDPSLVRPRGGELPIEQIGGHRLVVLAPGGRPEAPAFQAGARQDASPSTPGCQTFSGHRERQNPNVFFNRPSCFFDRTAGEF